LRYCLDKNNIRPHTERSALNNDPWSWSNNLKEVCKKVVEIAKRFAFDQAANGIDPLIARRFVATFFACSVVDRLLGKRIGSRFESVSIF
jgi:hypothetical protein